MTVAGVIEAAAGIIASSVFVARLRGFPIGLSAGGPSAGTPSFAQGVLLPEVPIAVPTAPRPPPSRRVPWPGLSLAGTPGRSGTGGQVGGTVGHR